MAEIRIGVDQNFENNQIKNVVAHQVTTGQRTTLGGTLGVSQAGLFVYDVTDLNMYVWSGTAWVNATQVVTNPMQIKGEIDASTNPAYPAAPSVGDVWVITVAGTVGGVTVQIGDQIVYSTNGWFTLQANLVSASTTTEGFIELATQAEVNTGTDAVRAVTPVTLLTNLDVGNPRAKIYRTAIATLTANTPLTITHNLNLGNAQDYVYKVSDATGTIKMIVKRINIYSLNPLR